MSAAVLRCYEAEEEALHYELFGSVGHWTGVTVDYTPEESFNLQGAVYAGLQDLRAFPPVEIGEVLPATRGPFSLKSQTSPFEDDLWGSDAIIFTENGALQKVQTEALGAAAAWMAASNIVLRNSTPMDEWERKAAAEAMWSEFV